MIIQNQVKCNKCGQEIFSAYRHDYQTCKCGNVSVDGGVDYLRRTGPGLTDGSVTEMSMSMTTEAVGAIIEAVNWGKDTGRNSFGIALAVVRALRKHGYINDKVLYDEGIS